MFRFAAKISFRELNAAPTAEIYFFRFLPRSARRGTRFRSVAGFTQAISIRLEKIEEVDDWPPELTTKRAGASRPNASRYAHYPRFSRKRFFSADDIEAMRRRANEKSQQLQFNDIFTLLSRGKLFILPPCALTLEEQPDRRHERKQNNEIFITAKMCTKFFPR